MASVTVKVTAGTEVQGKSGKLVMYLHDQALADAAATVTAEHALSMSDETVTLDANPESEQIGKKAKDMVQPSYYICVTGDVIGDPPFNRVAHGDTLDLKLKPRG
ncbi:unnamed protein product [Durusdinium trenchii]|uniref:Uncharacterized protein n=1 Tax=Durusdinium trenchii TaxID=1381693 RepID=A0ABP0N4Z2_9DINO